MFFCLLAGILLARPFLADRLLEMSVGARQNSAGRVLHSSFNTNVDRNYVELMQLSITADEKSQK